MVLQREQPVKIWGWADKGETVEINFQKKQYKITAGENGNWQLVLPPMKAGGPYSMQINEIELNNILIGDVWLCSGQSNMELPVRRVMDLYKKEVETYANNQIRHIKIPLAYNFHAPQPDIQPAFWKELNPENALDFSAVAYFFAKDLYEKTNVPIGLINSAVGGSPAEAWISEENLKHFPKYLNEKRICESDEYIANTKKLDNQETHLWNEVARRSDAGLNEQPKWNLPEYGDSAWNSIDLFDTSWSSDGVNPINGTHWFRKEFDIPKEQTGKKTVLRMGCVVDADSVFVNGVCIGTTSYQYPPRIYQIPENLLKEGKNSITVHLISYSGYPHFVKDKPYKLVFEDTEISLEGSWKYRQGAQMPARKEQTFFQYKPGGLYNGMIAPLENYAVKGVLWYQGESNIGRYNDYYDLMSALIVDWRSHWNKEDMPFLIVQLANFMQAYNYPTESNWAGLRDVQLQLSRNIPNVGLAVTIDIGEWNDIHPLNKKDVGKRLSLQAQRIAYNDKTLVADGPVYESMKITPGKIILSFKEGTNNLLPVDKLNGFAIAGEDGVYQWAEATIESNRVVVWNNNIPYPKKVRYAWADNPEGANLKNTAGLPASPFETK